MGVADGKFKKFGTAYIVLEYWKMKKSDKIKKMKSIFPYEKSFSGLYLIKQELDVDYCLAGKGEKVHSVVYNYFNGKRALTNIEAFMIVKVLKEDLKSYENDMHDYFHKISPVPVPNGGKEKYFWNDSFEIIKDFCDLYRDSLLLSYEEYLKFHREKCCNEEIKSLDFKNSDLSIYHLFEEKNKIIDNIIYYIKFNFIKVCFEGFINNQIFHKEINNFKILESAKSKERYDRSILLRYESLETLKNEKNSGYSHKLKELTSIGLLYCKRIRSINRYWLSPYWAYNGYYLLHNENLNNFYKSNKKGFGYDHHYVYHRSMNENNELLGT